LDGVKLATQITCTNGSLSTLASHRNITTSGPWYIGLDSTGAAPNPFLPYKGWISEVRIWNKARTEEEIRDNITTRLLPQQGLVGYYVFTSRGACKQEIVDLSTDDPAKRNNGWLGTTTSKDSRDPVWLSAGQISFTSADPTGVTNTCNCSGFADTLEQIRNEFVNTY
jgi:hypothetical protein